MFLVVHVTAAILLLGVTCVPYTDKRLAMEKSSCMFDQSCDGLHGVVH